MIKRLRCDELLDLHRDAEDVARNRQVPAHGLVTRFHGTTAASNISTGYEGHADRALSSYWRTEWQRGG
jgi:hypothetical protein